MCKFIEASRRDLITRKLKVYTNAEGKTGYIQHDAGPSRTLPELANNGIYTNGYDNQEYGGTLVVYEDGTVGIVRKDY